MNFVVLVGRVGGQVTTGQTQTGKTWANFSLATNRRKKDATFETTWHRIVAWEGLARTCLDIKKGDKVYVKGEISVREYESNGVKKQSYEIVAQDVLVGMQPSGEPAPVSEEGPAPW